MPNFYYGLLTGLLTLVGMLCSTGAAATAVGPDWLNGEPIYRDDSLSLKSEGCVLETWTIKGIYPKVYTNGLFETTHEVCVYHSNGYSYAMYNRDYYIYPWWTSFGAFNERGVAFALDGDSKMMPSQTIGNKDSSKQIYLGKDSKAYVQMSGDRSHVSYYKDMVSHLVHNDDGTLSLDNEPDYQFVDHTGNPLVVEGVGLSLDRKWLSFASRNIGVVTFNTDSMLQYRVSNRYTVLSSTWPEPIPATSVSNDGKYILFGGFNLNTELIVRDGSCGSINEALHYSSYATEPLQVGCSFRDLTSITNAHSDPTGSSHMPVFRDVQLDAIGSSFTYFDAAKYSRIYANPSAFSQSTRYLALGDSYASGEGDIDAYAIGHYLPGTDIIGNYANGVPREMCHLSDRSYPFLLGERAGLQRRLGVDSIACSGAMRINVAKISGDQAGYYEYENGVYLGQNAERNGVGRPRLAGLLNAAAMQQEARDNVLPGRVQQIEQLKLLQPDVATVQISGNDLRFGPIITACSKNLVGKLGPQYTDCDWSQPAFRSSIAAAILGNRSELVKLYHELQTASPNTQLYAVGYPLFIKQAAFCWHVPTLSIAEQEFIERSIRFLNQTVRSAASEAGIRYIDIEDALGDEVTCGNDGAMTSPIDFLSGAVMAEKKRGMNVERIIEKYKIVNPIEVQFVKMLYVNASRASDAVGLLQSPYVDFLGVMQQLFHPNAEGHRLIAKKISAALGDETILSANCDSSVIICPSMTNSVVPQVPTYYGPDLTVKGMVVEMSSIMIDKALGSDGVVQKIQDMPAVIRGNKIDITLLSRIPLVPPLSIALHSDTYNLGNLSKESDGSYRASISLPSTIEPGMHILEISGKTADGRIYKAFETLAIIGSFEDEDGDGVMDVVDDCLYATTCAASIVQSISDYPDSGAQPTIAKYLGASLHQVGVINELPGEPSQRQYYPVEERTSGEETLDAENSSMKLDWLAVSAVAALALLLTVMYRIFTSR